MTLGERIEILGCDVSIINLADFDVKACVKMSRNLLTMHIILLYTVL